MEWTEQRPWGRFLNLFESAATKVKLIEVDIGHQLSYQSHEHRTETWTVVKGVATVILDGETKILELGSTIQIPARSKHRLKNDSMQILHVIEVQTGTYFGEDDIHRYQDDYSRNVSVQPRSFEPTV